MKLSADPVQKALKRRQRRRFVYYALVALTLAVTMTGWALNSLEALETPGARMQAIGRLFGLLAAHCVLLELLLMSRAPFVDRNFDLQDVIDLHRLLGYSLIFSITVHALAIVAGYAEPLAMGWWEQFIDLIFNYDFLREAAIGTIIFFVATAVSVYVVRSRMRYEVWYAIHLTLYIAIVLTFLHQIPAGNDFLDSAWFTTYWYALFAAVSLAWLWYRLLRPVAVALWYNLRVFAVEQTAANTYSVFISGRQLERFNFEPGQYISWRILAPGLWTQAHPFSISSPLRNQLLRFTVKANGDYTAKLAQLKPGSLVLVDGPRGSFRADRAAGTRNVVMIAGGIGVAPFLPMANMFLTQGKRITLLYSVRTIGDVAFFHELKSLERLGVTIGLYANDKGQTITKDALKLVVNSDTTVYICGPDGMSRAFMKQLLEIGIEKERIITERFAF